MLGFNSTGYFPYTPATNLCTAFAKRCTCSTKKDSSRSSRGIAGWPVLPRAAVAAWGPDVACRCAEEASSVVTTVMMPAGHDADALRKIAVSASAFHLAPVWARLKGAARSGSAHIGDFNDLMLMGTLSESRCRS